MASQLDFLAATGLTDTAQVQRSCVIVMTTGQEGIGSDDKAMARHRDATAPTLVVAAQAGYYSNLLNKIERCVLVRMLLGQRPHQAVS